MGNPANDAGAELTWNGKQLKSHTTTNGYMTTVLHFAYDENGLRTEKGFVGNKTYYYYNGSVLIGMQRGNVTQRFSYDASGKVVSVNYNGTDYYYLRNAQGDIVKLIDNNSNTVVEYTYDSWGKILSTTGSKAATLGTDQPFRYRGYVYDNETGWYYLQTRYYDPSTNRFISSDVYLSTGQGVLGHNSYAYCLNNPCALTDTSGTEAVLAIGGVTISFAGLAVLAVCACFIIDLCINQEQSLAGMLIEALQMIVIDSITTVKTIWDSIVQTETKAADRVVKKPAARKRFNSKKKAREAAKKAGRGKPPIQHHNSPHGPHYHPNLPSNNPHIHDHYIYPW